MRSARSYIQEARERLDRMVSMLDHADSLCGARNSEAMLDTLTDCIDDEAYWLKEDIRPLIERLERTVEREQDRAVNWDKAPR